MKIYLESLGCKLNQAETEALTRQFIEVGHEVVGRVEEADIYILNTCTVTHTADSKSRHLIRQAKRRNQNVKVVVTGCYAVLAPEDLKDIGVVDLVLDNEKKNSLLEQLESAGLLDKVSSPASEVFAAPSLRTRTFVKIQDGCTNYCSYCIVPYVRGPEKSIAVDKVLEAISSRVEEGYQEIVLTGTRIGAYDNNGFHLKALVARILKETGVNRLRLSSLQPQELSEEFLNLWQDKRLCPHFHLSLQSGSDSILRRMDRRYTTSEYEKTVAMIRQIVSDVAVTTDIIVGFPGETDAEFKESLEFCREMEFARIHVFTYSARSGTAAAAMNGQVPETVKKTRSKQMLELAQESTRRFREKFTGEMLDVLWEKETADGVWSGVTGNYIRVYKKNKGNLTNRMARVRLD